MSRIRLLTLLTNSERITSDVTNATSDKLLATSNTIKSIVIQSLVMSQMRLVTLLTNSDPITIEVMNATSD
jgi:hypothetical protein